MGGNPIDQVLFDRDDVRGGSTDHIKRKSAGGSSNESSELVADGSASRNNPRNLQFSERLFWQAMISGLAAPSYGSMNGWAADLISTKVAN
jgi:hypothetical protein